MKAIDSLLPGFIKEMMKRAAFCSRYPTADLASPIRMQLDNKISLGRHVRLEGNVLVKGRVSIGDYTYIRGPASIEGNDEIMVSIGKYCSVASGVSIVAETHAIDYPSLYPMDIVHRGKKVRPYEKGDISIGNDVWLGKNSVILSGVNIGNGAIIGAGAVVTKDVEPYSIVGGVPAKLIKYRFGKKTIAELESLGWWDWENSKVKDNLAFFETRLSDENIREAVKGIK